MLKRVGSISDEAGVVPRVASHLCIIEAIICGKPECLPPCYKNQISINAQFVSMRSAQ